MKTWCVLRTKPRRERHVNHVLRLQGHETYFPVYWPQGRTPDTGTPRPFFPGYFFIRLDLAIADLSKLEWTPGVGHLVRFGGQVATVADGAMYSLRQRLEALRQKQVNPLGDIQRGDRVRLTADPFAGHEAIFDTRLPGSDRARVFLNWLGRLVPAEVSLHDLYRVRVRTI